MKILNIEIQNFKPFREVILPDNGVFGDGLFLICGKNSMGKSSIIEAILWGLFGENLFDSQQRKQLLRIGEKNCKVDITFELGESIYRITRKISVRTNHRARREVYSYDAALSKKEGNRFSVVLSDPNRVNLEVEKMVGITSEIIKKTVYIRQKEVDDLARADGTELRRLITTFFDLDELDQIKDNLRDRSSNLQNSISTLNQSVGTLSSEEVELNKREQEMDKCNSDIISKETDLEYEIKECSKIPLEEVLIRIGDIQNEITEVERKLDIIKTRINDKTKLIETSDSRVSKFKTSITKMNDDKRKDQEQLKLLPSRENLERLSELQSRVLNLEYGIRNVVTRSGLKIEFNPIQNPDQTKTRYELVTSELKAIEEYEDQLCKSIEELNRRLSLNGALSNLKINSINYIKEKNNCPVCNKPVENRNSLISQINNEVSTINLGNGSINKELNQQTSTLKHIKAEISSYDEFRNLLSSILPFTEDLISCSKHLSSLLSTFTAQSIQDFLTRVGFSSISDIISRRAVLESNIQGYVKGCMDLEKDITSEIDQYKEYQTQLSEDKNTKRILSDNINRLKSQLQHICHDLSVDSIENLMHRHKCETIQKLMTKRKVLESSVSGRREIISSLRSSLLILNQDITDRKNRIKELEAKGLELRKQHNELRHVRFLGGEIDGFISNYVVEGKLVEILKKATNYYLMPFTEGRYTINKIFSMTKRVRDKESHGLEISLFDARDNNVKYREQLSGGDETALGLALRIAISKLMGRIRPFKESERQLPKMNSIIMDEPMASLDASRRQAMINMLMQDKSFRQIFLITHTDSDFGECSSILVNDEDNGQRLIEYKPLQS